MGFSLTVLDERPGFALLEIGGPDAQAKLKHEPGGHRWQAVSPTDKHGRVQTSTITVAVMTAPEESKARIKDSDIEWQATRGSGKGGQARNKTSNAVQMKHIPSGLTVRVESERSQSQNRASALRLLAAKLNEHEKTHAASLSAAERRAQVGSGQRGDKVRTIRTQDNSVVQHATGKRVRLDKYLKGFIEELA